MLALNYSCTEAKRLVNIFASDWYGLINFVKIFNFEINLENISSSDIVAGVQLLFFVDLFYRISRSFLK